VLTLRKLGWDGGWGTASTGGGDEKKGSMRSLAGGAGLLESQPNKERWGLHLKQKECK